MYSARKKPIAAILMFIAPVMIYYSLFIIYPIGATIYNSFHTMYPSAGRIITEFVGLRNFRELFQDEIFLLSIRNTTIWAIVGPTAEMLVATALAFIVYFRVPFYRFYRIAWFTPVLITGVIVGIVFKWIFNFEWGLVNVGLRTLGLDSLAINWLGRPNTALGVVIFVHFWNTFGYSFILLLAGLSAVPRDVLESAQIDGATSLRICTSILFPMILPVFITTTILSFMGKMRAFHVVWVLTNGGPMHHTETVATYVQKRAFGWSSLDLGYSSSIAVFWFILVIIGVTLINRWLQSKVQV
ncbi:MAG: sugar ABC transporter permease [Spirochaetota bacterium]|nr:sugar ABC transporter permease [Spirochaetota bacterium]